jgi:acetolactate synthase I/III small subunit
MNANNRTSDLQAVLELMVNNHPGVMSHVCGLFSRRAFNVDGILCMPMSDHAYSRIWLRVQEGERLDQVVSQLQKLHDVHQVVRHSPDHEVFSNLELFFDKSRESMDACVNHS